MNIEAVKMNELLSEENDIYKTIMIVANRARQIIDERYIEQVDLEDIEDSEQLIELSKEDFDKELTFETEYTFSIGQNIQFKDFNKEQEVEADLAKPIPKELWTELKKQSIIEEESPIDVF